MYTFVFPLQLPESFIKVCIWMKLPGLMKLSEDQCNLGIKGSKLGIHRSVNT